MDTIRCPRCQKLLRADAQICSRCGVAITAGKTPRRRTTSGVDDALMPSHPTNPPASPHRAGHYSGLHSEDQPFQSSFFVRVQRPPEPVDTEGSTLLDLGTEQSATPRTARPESPLLEEEEDTPVFSSLADFPTLYSRRAPNTPIPERSPSPPLSRRPTSRIRVMPLLLTGALICFLVATSLLTFLLLGKNQSHSSEPRLLALPGELRVGDILQLSGSGFDAQHVVALERDAQMALSDARGQRIMPTTDTQGAFLIRVPITAAWGIGVHRLQASEGTFKTSTSLTIQAAVSGPPNLQLGVSHIDLGAGNPGTLSYKNMTLTNSGGGRITWTAKSNAAWLSLNPASGTFVGNAVTVLTVNRANLAPQAYVGQIVFTQDQSHSQTLYVSMIVNTTPANLVLSTVSLAFAGTPAQSPAGQAIVIQNNGGQALDWTSGSTTSNGLNWLSVTPASGLLAARASTIVTVNVDTIQMPLGTFQGGLSFSYAGGPAQQVAITLTVSPPPQPALHLSSQHLSFATNQGFNPPAQSVTISNSGNAPLNWAIHADSSGQTYLAISPVSGSVPPGQSASVSIAPLLGSASGTIKSTLTVLDSDTGTIVPSQPLNISIAITNQPVITLSNGKLEFDHDSVTTDTSELLIFSNTGNLPLNWTVSASSQVPWLSFDTTSGTLAAGQSVYINLRCISSQMRAGTYTVTLTLRDSDAGSVVAPQVATITLVVLA